MTATLLATRLARQIADHIRTSGLQIGDRLPERRLAEQFRVSRSPIKNALAILERDALIRHEPEKGFFVAALPVLSTSAPVKVSPPAPEERLYLQIARDHLAGHLMDRVSENAMMRRYDIKRGQVIRILRRAAEEGWAERLPGHGWAFLPVLASAQAFEAAYHFRLVIEPAGILQDSFRLDRPALELARQQQQAIVDGDGYHLSAAELFNSGSRFHEIIMQCSGNAFLIDSLTRLNRLRRLIEYRSIDDRAGWLKRAAEHIALVDLLLQGDRETASDFMRRHLEGGIRAKRFEADEPEADTSAVGPS